VHAADWHDGQISHNTHSKIARRAADPISACRYRKPHWVRDNIARDFAIQELAEAVALAPRTFARRVPATCGVSPIQFVQQIRLETADHPPVGRADRPAGRICGTLDASQADPARHQAFARTFSSRRLSRLFCFRATRSARRPLAQVPQLLTSLARLQLSPVLRLVVL